MDPPLLLLLPLTAMLPLLLLVVVVVEGPSAPAGDALAGRLLALPWGPTALGRPVSPLLGMRPLLCSQV
jgi:hypothetical protein